MSETPRTGVSAYRFALKKRFGMPI